MTILYATPYFTERGKIPEEGGLEAYLIKVAGTLVEFGHIPIIVALGAKELHYIENGIEVYFVKYQKVQVARNGNINYFYNCIRQSGEINKRIRDILRERNVDIIQFPSSEGLALCYYGKKPAVLRLSSYAKTHSRGYSLNRMDVNVRILSEQMGAWRCNAIFGPSKVIAEAFAKDAHRAVDIIETPIGNDCQIRDDNLYCQNLSGKKYVLFVGALYIVKGILVIAECIQRFLAHNPEYYFVCCGRDGIVYDKSTIQMLRQAAGKYKERVLYFGVLPHKELYPIMQYADFLICPSIAENFSNACIEAMYFQRVVIGTDGTSYEQLIDSGKNGLLCMPGDADSLLEKMNAAAAMSEVEKAEMGRNARKRVDRLKPEIAVNKLLRYYQYVIENVHN